MSDPVKNVEIEDVLSSIRRLVTEEGREKPKSGTKPSQPVGRLVLTPSLRVSEPSDDEEQPEQDAPATAETSGTDSGDVLTLSRDLRSVSFADEIEFRRDASKLRRTVAEEANSDDAEDNSASDMTAAPEPESPGDTAKPSGARNVTYDMPEPTTGEFAEVRTPWKRPDATLHEAADLASEPEVDAPLEDSVPQQEASKPTARTAAVASDPLKQAAAMRSASLSAKIKALEAAIAERAEKWEPDGSAEEVFETAGHAPMAWREPAQDTTEQPNQVEQAAPDAPVAEAEDLLVEGAATKTDAEEPDEGDDAVMDEEALRELVAEIVRQELRGALGERITRNVRKLVRREIQRALATQALE